MHRQGEALALDPTHVRAHANRGAARGRMGMYREALADLAVRREAIDATRTQLAFVHMGSEAQAAPFFARYALQDLVRPAPAAGAITDEPSGRVVAIVWGTFAALATIVILTAVVFRPFGWSWKPYSSARAWTIRLGPHGRSGSR